MSDLVSFDTGCVSDGVFDNCTEQELYFVCIVNLLVLSKMQVDDLLDTSEKIYKIQRPSQVILPLGMFRWWYGLSRTSTITNLQRLYYHSQKLLRAESLKIPQKTRLRKHLQRSLNGLKKLVETYRSDLSTISRLKLLQEETSDYCLEEQ